MGKVYIDVITMLHLEKVGIAERGWSPDFAKRYVHMPYAPHNNLTDWRVPDGVSHETLKHISRMVNTNTVDRQQRMLRGLETGIYTVNTAAWSVWSDKYRKNPTTEIRRWIDDNLYWMESERGDHARIARGRIYSLVIRHAISYIIQYGEQTYIEEFEGVTAADVLKRMGIDLTAGKPLPPSGGVQ